MTSNAGGRANPRPRIRLYSIGRLPWYQKGSRLFFFYTPRLGLPCIAASTPADWDITIHDGVSLAEIDYETPVDMVGFSVLTPFATDTYAAADIFRHRSVPVVMGGVHATLMPEEAKSHSDAVVMGEGEAIWPRLLNDFRAGRLQHFYRHEGRPLPIESLPVPRFSAVRHCGGYNVAHAIQPVRGCPHGHSCPFCVVPLIFGARPRMMPIPIALEQIKILSDRDEPGGLNLSACCPLNHTEYIISLAKSIAPLRIEWSGAGLPERLDDDSLLETLRAGGCTLIYTESPIVSPRKNRRKYAVYCSAMRKIQAHGISVSYNFTIGFDDDDNGVLNDVSSFIEDAGLNKDLCAVQVFAPWPNTPAFNSLDQEGRIIDRNWSHYDNTRSVFTPKRMSVSEFERVLQRGTGRRM